MAEEDLIARLRATGQRAFRSAMSGAARDVRGVGRSSKSSAKEIGFLESASRGAAGGLLAVGRAAKLGLAGAAIGTGVAIREGTAYNKTIDQQRVGFETLLGSQRKARKFMREIQQLALRSPILDPRQTGDAARMLMAYGLSARHTLPFVKALGDMAAASGKSLEETLPRGAMALGQVASKGRLQAEELNQLAESVGLSRDRIRQALGETRAEFNAHFQPGGNPLSSRKALPAILEAMRQQSAGAADRLAKTTQGKFARLHEVFAKSMGRLTRPLYNAAGDLAGGVANLMRRVDFGKLTRQAQGIGKTIVAGFGAGMSTGGGAATGGFSGIAGFAAKAGAAVSKMIPWLKRAGRTLVETFRPAAPFLQNVLLPLLIGVGKGVAASVVGAFKVAIPVVGALMKVLGFLGRAAAPLRPVFEGIGTVLGFIFAGPILKLLSGIPKLGLVFRLAAVPIRLLGKVVGVAARFLGRVFAPALKFVGRVFGTVTSVIRKGVGLWLEAHRQVLLLIVKGMRALGGKLVGAAKGVMGKVWAFFRGLGRVAWSIGKGIVEGIARGIASAPAALLNALRTALKKAIDGLPGPLKEAAGAVIGFFAEGGSVRRSGAYVVGERGPEVVNLRAGDQVTPNAALGARAALAAGARALLEVRVVSELYGREVGRGLARVAADDLARA